MTMHASKVEGTPNVQVVMNYGPINARIEEHHSHLRYFHGQLGQLLDQMEADAKAAVETV